MPVPVRHVVLGAASLVLAVTGSVVAVTRPSTTPVPTAASDAVVVPIPVSSPPAPLVRPAPLPTRAASRPVRRAPGRAVKVDPYGRFGFDISWPQCRKDGSPVLPPPLGPLAIIGLTNGHPFSTNRCLAAQGRWARSRSKPGAYVNLAFPRDGSNPRAYGARTVVDALARAAQEGVTVRSLWLDIEVGNHWSGDKAANVQVLRGAEAALKARGLGVGVYSSPLDWHRITGDTPLTIPVWQALPDGRVIVQGCTSAGFGGRSPDLVQAVFSAPDGHQVDGDLICTARPDFQRIIG